MQINPCATVACELTELLGLSGLVFLSTAMPWWVLPETPSGSHVPDPHFQARATDTLVCLYAQDGMGDKMHSNLKHKPRAP